VSGGYVVYYTPVNLVGYTARMTIKDKIGGTVLATLVMQAGTGFVIDTAAQTDHDDHYRDRYRWVHLAEGCLRPGDGGRIRHRDSDSFLGM